MYRSYVNEGIHYAIQDLSRILTIMKANNAYLGCLLCDTVKSQSSLCKLVISFTMLSRHIS